MNKIKYVVFMFILLVHSSLAACFGRRNKLPKEKHMSAYLMVYHKDADHGLHMAISRDGNTFTALNNDKPIFSGDTIAMQHGIRDPHIYRGPDGAFYLSMRDGFRQTEWERDGRTFGWGNNRGIVLMKSHDLINWTRANIDFTAMDSSLSDIGCAWAPETVYDEESKKLMIHFTMRHKAGINSLYYVYVNDDYNRVETLPQLLLQAPGESYNIIDGDIVKYKGKYHLFYVSHEKGAGICHTSSDNITGPYTPVPQYITHQRLSHEAPSVWKIIGQNKWRLMYDIYGARPHTFGFEETDDFTSFTPVGRFNDATMTMTNCVSPKHGAVVHITEEEARRLEKKWNNQ